MRRQCPTCPWLEGATTDAIPGYVREKHEALRDTIAAEGDITNALSRRLPIMVCHYSKPGAEHPCVGWLHHQLGDGNNIVQRLAALHDATLGRYELAGPQRSTFEETFACGIKKGGA